MPDLSVLMQKVATARRELATLQGRLQAADSALSEKQAELEVKYGSSDVESLQALLETRQTDFDARLIQIEESIKDLKV